MNVRFTKHNKNGRVACSWVARRGRTVIPGPYMPAGKDLPHDLGQYVVEAATGTANGFWGLIDQGATFKSTGRKATKPGRAIIRAHRDDLDGAEIVANVHLAAWRNGEVTEATPLLDDALRQWSALAPDSSIEFDWPSPIGRVVDER